MENILTKTTAEIHTKKCSNKECQQVKPLSEFNGSKITTDHYQSWCKECQKKSYARWYAKQKEKGKNDLAEALPEGMKKCRNIECNKIKPVEEFCKDSRLKDGLSNRCKECHRNTGKKFRQRKRYEEQFIKTLSKPHLNNLLLKKAMSQYNLNEEELRFCQKENKYKPAHMFRSSMTSEDGISKNCVDCIFQMGIRDAIQKEILGNQLKKRVDIRRVILFPMTMESFLNLRIVNREEKPKPPIEKNEYPGDYSRDRKIRNDYFFSGKLSDGGEFYPEREYCEGEPPSSYKDFIIMNEKIKSVDTESVLLDRGELLHTTKQLQLLVKNTQSS